MTNDPEPVGGGSSEVIKLTNGWSAGNHCVTTLIQGGVLIYQGHKGNGTISVSHFLPNDSGPSGGVEIPDSGAIEIVDAPLGARATAEGGLHGDLRFHSVTGFQGTLHLEDCSVEFEPPVSVPGIKVDKCRMSEAFRK